MGASSESTVPRETYLRYSEPVRMTLARTGAIAGVLGAVFAWRWGSVAYWPMAFLLGLWPALGGHFVELFFLNFLRPRIAPSRAAQVATRLAVWFGGGIVLAVGMWLTAMALGRIGPMPKPGWWWIAGLAFAGIELVAHLALQFRGRPSFYNGRG